MSNESVFLPAAVRDRIWDLLKERKVTQAELAARIGCSESSLSRFISGKTDKLGDESIIRIARVFEVSTDFLLGEVDEPDRKTTTSRRLASPLRRRGISTRRRSIPKSSATFWKIHSLPIPHTRSPDIWTTS